MLRFIYYKIVVRAYGSFLRLLLCDREIYYGKYFNTSNRFVTTIKNIINPSSIKLKYNYGQWPQWRKRVVVKKMLESASEEAIEIYGKIERDGYAILPGRYERQVKSYLSSQAIELDNYLPSDDYYRSEIGFAPEIIEILSDIAIYQALELHYCKPPKLRMTPCHNITYPNENYSPESKARLNCDWHFDTPNLMQVWVLLTDVTKEGTRTLFAKGGHRTHYINVADYDYNFSEKYIEKNFEIVDCIGPLGTAIIFNTNSPHRCKPVKNSLRSTIDLLYTPGNHMIKPKHKLDPELFSHVILRDLLSHLK